MIRLSSAQHRSRTPSQVRGILGFIERANDHDFNLSIGGPNAKPDDEAAISRNGTVWNAYIGRTLQCSAMPRTGAAVSLPHLLRHVPVLEQPPSR